MVRLVCYHHHPLVKLRRFIVTRGVVRLSLNVVGQKVFVKKVYLLFLKMGHSQSLFHYFHLFNTVDCKCSI